MALRSDYRLPAVPSRRNSLIDSLAASSSWFRCTRRLENSSFLRNRRRNVLIAEQPSQLVTSPFALLMISWLLSLEFSKTQSTEHAHRYVYGNSHSAIYAPGSSSLVTPKPHAEHFFFRFCHAESEGSSIRWASSFPFFCNQLLAALFWSFASSSSFFFAFSFLCYSSQVSLISSTSFMWFLCICKYTYTCYE